MPSPLAHVSGLLNSVLVPGTAAMTVVLMEKWDAERGVHLAGEYGATFMIGPPTLFVGMMEVPDFRSRVHALRVVSCGSMGVTPEFIDSARLAFGAMVKRTYGSTEAPTVTTSTSEDGPDRARDTDGRSVGEAVIRVVDPVTDRPVPAGRRGRGPRTGPRALRGLRGGVPDSSGGPPGVVRHRRPRRPRPRGLADHRRTPEGADHPRGENIASAEVERVLEQHPEVRQAVVVGCPDRRLGERVAAFVVGSPRVDVAECRRWFAAQGVARFKTPEVVVHLDEIPLLGVGKPDRPVLRERAATLAVAES